jgi:hypothetical protein
MRSVRVCSSKAFNPATTADTAAGCFLPAADVPIGGTTGLCHEASAAISEAAAWYRANRYTCERPLIPALQRRFGLSVTDVLAALKEARG